LALGDGTPEGVEGLHISEAAKAGNEIAVAAFNELGSALGLGMANLSAILDPEIFVIGGGVSAAGEILLAPIRDTYSKNLTARDHRPMPDVVVATLGNDAGMVGAADLARGA
jgi:glucokinase